MTRLQAFEALLAKLSARDNCPGDGLGLLIAASVVMYVLAFMAVALGWV